MRALGLVFTNINDKNISELTSLRTMGSVPFGGRYRLVDFVLSSMSNAGISKVGLITKSNFQSLMDHVGSGKNWDLARKNGGLMILPPFGSHGVDMYTTRIDALKNAEKFLEKNNEDYVIMSDTDSIFNIDLKDVLRFHEKNLSDITLVYRKLSDGEKGNNRTNYLVIDNTNRVIDMTKGVDSDNTENQYMKIMVVRRQLLINLVREAHARNNKHLITEVLRSELYCLKVMAYNYTGYFACLSSLQAYYDANMDMLIRKNRDMIFNNDYLPIRTKIKDSPPTKFGEDAKVKGSFVADGCIIDGTVENSIIFRGTKINKGTVVKNCIIMQDNIIGDNSSLNAIITDKNVIIRDKVTLSGNESLPFYIGKGKRV